MAMHEVYDPSPKEVMSSAAVLDVIPSICATKYPTSKRDVSRSWMASVVRTQEGPTPSEAVGKARRVRVQKGDGQVSVGSLLEKKQLLVSKTVGVDGFIPSLVKLLGLGAVGALIQYLRQAYKNWPEEVWRILHLTLKKYVGNDGNVNMRPIKLMSARFRLQAKMLAPTVMLATGTEWSAGRQFAGYKGGSCHAARRMLHVLLTQSLAVHGSCVIVFLYLIGAFDEVMRASIQAVADVADAKVSVIMSDLLDVGFKPM